MSHEPVRPVRRIAFHLDRDAVLPLALTALLIAALAWAFALRADRDHAEEAITVLQAEVAELREGANATAYMLQPSIDAPANAGGTAFFALDATGVISVVNLAQPPEGRSYQVWYYPTAESEPLPGATFAVDAQGTGFMLIPADVGVFTTVTVTLEPEAGTTSPSGPVILTGTTGGARG